MLEKKEDCIPYVNVSSAMSVYKTSPSSSPLGSVTTPVSSVHTHMIWQGPHSHTYIHTHIHTYIHTSCDWHIPPQEDREFHKSSGVEQWEWRNHQVQENLGGRQRHLECSAPKVRGHDRGKTEKQHEVGKKRLNVEENHCFTEQNQGYGLVSFSGG